MRGDWRSYDGIAKRYDAVWGPRLQAAARHLINLLDPAPGHRALDIGTGTGLVASALSDAVAGLGLVAGCDRAASMLRHAKARRPELQVVGGDATALPFRDEAFDLATAGFLLSHAPDYRRALGEAFRVLRSSAVLAVSNWAPASDPYTAAWTELLAKAVTREAVDRAVASVAPWEAHLADTDRLRAALAEAGFEAIRVETVQLESAFSVEAFVADRDLGSSGRFARDLLGHDEWSRFLAEVKTQLGTRFGHQFSYRRGVLLAAGRKP